MPDGREEVRRLTNDEIMRECAGEPYGYYFAVLHERGVPYWAISTARPYYGDSSNSEPCKYDPCWGHPCWGPL